MPRLLLALLGLALPFALHADPTATAGALTASVMDGAADSGAANAENAPLVARTLEFGSIPPAVIEAAKAARGLPLAARLKAVTEPFLDAPYVSDALGEGGGIDPDPLARYDVFDCLTFVEEALALALTGDPEHAASARIDLRYLDRTVDYGHRKHFMELQWLPDNVRRGWIRDTTADYGETRPLRAEVTAARWRAWGRRSLFKLADHELPTGQMALDVLPLEQALAIYEQIRPGSIVLTVREPREWIPIWTTHLGFTIPAAKPTIRHASRMSKSLRVRDHDLKWYLGTLTTYKHWKVAGVAIFEPVEQGPRLTAPPAAPE